MSEEVGGCEACSTCVGFKSISKTGKFCARCSHPHAKHFVGEKPAPVESSVSVAPSAASVAPVRPTDLKLFKSFDEEDPTNKPQPAKATPMRRMSNNQNPLANRSPMRKTGASPPPPGSEGSSTTMEGEKAPVISDMPKGPSLKDRIAMYAKASHGSRSSENHAHIPRPNSVSVQKSSDPLQKPKSPSVPFSSHTRTASTPTVTPVSGNTPKPELEPPSSAPLDSPSKRRMSIKDRIAVYTANAHATPALEKTESLTHRSPKETKRLSTAFFDPFSESSASSNIVRDSPKNEISPKKMPASLFDPFVDGHASSSGKTAVDPSCAPSVSKTDSTENQDHKDNNQKQVATNGCGDDPDIANTVIVRHGDRRPSADELAGSVAIFGQIDGGAPTAAADSGAVVSEESNINHVRITSICIESFIFSKLCRFCQTEHSRKARRSSSEAQIQCP